MVLAIQEVVERPLGLATSVGRSGASMPTPLPKQLAYLAHAIKELEKFDPDSLGDDNPDAMDLVESAVRTRIRGMDADAARTAIEEDSAALQQWLRQDDLVSSPAHFIYGGMLGMTMFGDFDELSS